MAQNDPPATWKLRQFRRERALNQTEAGALVGVTKRTWLVWENGRGVPAEEPLIRLYVASEGWITPNDFYKLPVLQSRKLAA